MLRNFISSTGRWSVDARHNNIIAMRSGPGECAKLTVHLVNKLCVCLFCGHYGAFFHSRGRAAGRLMVTRVTVIENNFNACECIHLRFIASALEIMLFGRAHVLDVLRPYGNALRALGSFESN